MGDSFVQRLWDLRYGGVEEARKRGFQAAAAIATCTVAYCNSL